MKLLLHILIFSVSVLIACGQSTQSIKGLVLERTSKQPLPGANVVVANSDPILGATTNESGEFTISNVPIGRQSVQCSFVGYTTFESDPFIVTTAKEVWLTVELSEGTTLEGIEVTSVKVVSEPTNEMALVSARSFSVEETERISASVNDMGRMALSFPGVQKGSNDTENDVIIRGNSSYGVLWRLEGIDIPNPNHFARPGTSGGGITVFSAQVLDRSDFYSGGMPGEYGNALAGVYDVHFKRGNFQEREYRAKIGLLGLDFANEGPIVKGRSSYVFNYRYSTLGLLNNMGFHLVGERVSNNFQDLSFNIATKSKDNTSQFTVFGVGGLSEEHYTPVKNPAERMLGVADNWEDRILVSNMGTLGATYAKTFSEKAYLHIAAAFMGSDINRKSDTLDISNNRFRYNTQHYLDKRVSTALSFTYKFDSHYQLKTGLISHFIQYDFSRVEFARKSQADVTTGFQNIDQGAKRNTQTIQLYAADSWQLNNQLTMSSGLHVLYFALNQKVATDPRLSFRYQFNDKHRLSYATGQYSQLLPLPTYFITVNDTLPDNSILKFNANKNLPMIRSWHHVLSYVFSFSRNFKITTEAYHQHLTRVPVNSAFNKTYYMLNNQDYYPTFAARSKGSGNNMGLDVVAEKSFANRFYFILTGSLMKSTFQPENRRTYNTKFNSTWTTTGTVGKEIQLSNGNLFQFGGRVLFNGGFRYSPYDPILSQQQKKYVELDGAQWSAQAPNYFRLDTRVSYRFNKPKFTGLISLDIQNVTSRANVVSIGYDPATNKTYNRTYDGASLIPILAFQLDF